MDNEEWNRKAAPVKDWLKTKPDVDSDTLTSIKRLITRGDKATDDRQIARAYNGLKDENSYLDTPIEGFGRRQSNTPDFVIASLTTIKEHLITAHTAAFNANQMIQLTELRRPRNSQPIQHEDAAAYATHKTNSRIAGLTTSFKHGDWDGTIEGLGNMSLAGVLSDESRSED